MISFAGLLWVINFALLVISLRFLVWVLQGRGNRINEQRVANLAEANGYLEEVGPASDLIAAWRAVAANAPRPKRFHNLDPLVQMIYWLWDGRSDDVQRVRDLATAVINNANNAAALVDEGLVRPIEFVKYEVAVTSDLMTSLALAEPVVWYEALVNGRGRWGYRVPQLRRVLDRLRAHSSDPELWNEVALSLNDRTFLLQGRMSLASRLLLRLGHIFLSPTIGPRSKVRQKTLASEIQAKLTDIVNPVLTSQRPILW